MKPRGVLDQYLGIREPLTRIANAGRGFILYPDLSRPEGDLCTRVIHLIGLQ